MDCAETVVSHELKSKFVLKIRSKLNLVISRSCCCVGEERNVINMGITPVRPAFNAFSFVLR